MDRHARLLAFALCASSLAAPAAVSAQTPAPAAGAAQKKSVAAAKKPKGEAADPMAEVRRASAVSLVSTLADEARTFSEPALRARVQARAGDALWETDKEKARQLFRRAWEAAEAADRETANLSDAERRRRAIAQGGAGARGLLNLRREVVILTARRDRELGEEFLAKLDESRKDEAGAPATTAPQVPVQTNEQRINPDNPPPAMQQRLNLAQQLLDEGNIEQALQFADSALYPVNTFGMNILNTLREKNKAAADQRFMSLVTRAGSDPLSDANSISLLSSYVFTPFLYVTVRPDGNSHTRQWRGDIAPPADTDPRVRQAFLSAAFQVLLRPLPPAEEDRTSSGRMGAYVVATRMLPLFERHAPDRAPALRARQAQLAQDTPDRSRRIDDELLTRGVVPEDPNRDRVQDTLDRLERAKNSNERDVIYFRAAMEAFSSDPARGRELASKIEDPDTRKQLYSFMAFQQMQEAVRGKKADDALRFARSDELTRVQRVWGLTEVARLLAKEQPGRAAEALDEATAEARKLDDRTPERVRALLAVATQLAELDRPRAWETMQEVVKSANDLSDFSGEGGDITVRVEFKGGGAMTQNHNVESFDLTGIFAALARDDFDRAAALARTLKAEGPRAVATLAVVRSVLVKKQEPAVAAN
jgi:histone H3/H4